MSESGQNQTSGNPPKEMGYIPPSKLIRCTIWIQCYIPIVPASLSILFSLFLCFKYLLGYYPRDPHLGGPYAIYGAVIFLIWSIYMFVAPLWEWYAFMNFFRTMKAKKALLAIIKINVLHFVILSAVLVRYFYFYEDWILIVYFTFITARLFIPTILWGIAAMSKDFQYE